MRDHLILRWDRSKEITLTRRDSAGDYRTTEAAAGLGHERTSHGPREDGQDQDALRGDAKPESR